MKKQTYLSKILRHSLGILMILAFFSVYATADTPTGSGSAKPAASKKAAAKPKAKPGSADEDQIHVSADALVSDRNANYAEFQGNVVTTQKGSTMFSDRLKIFYIQDPTKKKTAKNPNSQGAIDKIVATGNVKIKMEDKTAWADKAVYTKNDDSILLSGGNPRIFSGKNYLTGETIRVNRKTEEVFVNAVPGSTQPSGKPGKRVEMNIFTNDPDLKK